MGSAKIIMYDLGDSNARYLAALERAGAAVLPFKYVDSDAEARAIAESHDGLLLPGGCDVNPALYNRPVKSWCKRIDDRRDEVEMALLRAFVALGKPVLGICRGAQIMNVFFGGTLYQDILSETDTKTDHFHDVNDGAEPFHDVTLAEGSFLRELFGEERVGVNSLHHQSAAEVPDCLSVTAVADDGIIEALEHRQLPFAVAIQWHPERLAPTDEKNFEIFQAFVAACEQAHEQGTLA